MGIMTYRQLTNIYCIDCSAEHNLPRDRNVGYAECVVCKKTKPCCAATMDEIEGFRASKFGRKIA